MVEQTRESYEESIRKKRERAVAAKKAAEARERMLKETPPIMVDDVDIRHCVGCLAEKVTVTMGEVDGKEVAVRADCSSYPIAGQVRWMRLGWCPLGNSGPKQPETKEQREKRRAGQQKQKKR